MGISWRGGATGLVIGALLCAPAAAPAASVGHSYGRGGEHVVWYLADTGERNQLTVDRSATGVTFLDLGAVITTRMPPNICTPLAVLARCKLTPASDIGIGLGDQDDRMSSAASDLGVVPGAGADLIEGTGAFRIQDSIDDGRPDRYLAPNATVEYPAYYDRTPVSVTLDGQANDGGANEYDDVRAVNVVVGIDGSVIVGDGRDNALSATNCRPLAAPTRLEGGAGDDRLVACRGTNLLYGGPGDDDLASGGDGATLVGGPGRDTYRGEFAGARPLNVDARDGEQDTVQCTAGMTVLADALDVINGSCASVTVAP